MAHQESNSKIEALETFRLRLIPGTAELLHTEIEHPPLFSETLGAAVPPNWPPAAMRPVHLLFLQQLEQNPEFTGWLTWYWLLNRPLPASLIGCGGFKGPPQQGGHVEIGYSVLSQYRRQGYATEAVAALSDWAFSHPEVTRIMAETARINHPSIRVLEKVNFLCLGETESPRTLFFELQRNQHLRQSTVYGSPQGNSTLAPGKRPA